MELVLDILRILFYLVSGFVAFYFCLPVILYILYVITGGSKKKNAADRYKKQNDIEHDFAAIITVHQDTRFIAPLVDSFIKQDYHNFKVYIVADDCDLTNISF